MTTKICQCSHTDHFSDPEAEVRTTVSHPFQRATATTFVRLAKGVLTHLCGECVAHQP